MTGFGGFVGMLKTSDPVGLYDAEKRYTNRAIETTST